MSNPNPISPAVQRVARASFKIWAEHQENNFVFEDMTDEELEFAFRHAQACIDAYVNEGLFS